MTQTLAQKFDPCPQTVAQGGKGSGIGRIADVVGQLRVPLGKFGVNEAYIFQRIPFHYLNDTLKAYPFSSGEHDMLCPTYRRTWCGFQL